MNIFILYSYILYSLGLNFVQKGGLRIIIFKLPLDPNTGFLRIQWKKIRLISLLNIISAILGVKCVNVLLWVLYKFLTTKPQVSFVILRIKLFTGEKIRY